MAPHDINGWSQAALCCICAKKYDAARSLLTRGLATNKDNRSLSWVLAHTYVLEKRDTPGWQPTVDTTFLDELISAAEQYNSEGKSNGAEAMLTAAITLYDRSEKAWLELGKCYQTKPTTDAVDAFQLAYRINRSVESICLYGSQLILLKREDEAEKILSEGLNQYPNDLQIRAIYNLLPRDKRRGGRL